MLSNKRLVGACAFVLICNLGLLVLFVIYQTGERCYVTIDEHQKVIAIIPDDFLSIGIDASEIENYDKIDFKKRNIRSLAAALSPARLRLGGTMSERLVFSRSDQPPPSCHAPCHANHSKHFCSYVKNLCKHKVFPFFILTGQKWTQINEFCNATNLKLLFSLNVLLRDEHGWNDLNARDLLDYSKHKHFRVDWQLGNEPNSFRHVFNETISPHKLAQDFGKLRRLLNSTGYKNSLLIGPDTTRPQPDRPECLKYMEEFLKDGVRFINARSWHQYYLNGRTATLEDFWNPDTFDLLEQQIETMQNHTAAYDRVPMWLTETSSAYGGGAPELSDSYAGSPLWLDKLGLAARHNVATVVRQSFVGGAYGLLDERLRPRPDWWLSVLYKRLVGGRVLGVRAACSRRQRVYAHCAGGHYARGALTLYAVNLAPDTVRLALNGSGLPARPRDIDEFVIRAPANDRRARTVWLNGRPLLYSDPLPPLAPRRLPPADHVTMPPYSIGFWVIKNTSIHACK